MMFWLLIYDLVDDYLERRAALRSDHLELAQRRRTSAVNCCSRAPSTSPPTRRYSCSASMTAAVIEDFVERDPYVQQGWSRTGGSASGRS